MYIRDFICSVVVARQVFRETMVEYTEDGEGGYIVLSEQDYNKGKFLFQGQIHDLLEEVFDMYGMGIYISGVTLEIVQLAEDWGQYIRGDLSKPISLKYIRRNGR